LKPDTRATVPHGQFERLFSNHADPLPEPVTCSLRSAQCFMAIARNTALSNTQHVALLPRDWGVLAGLASLPADKLEIALSEGWVRPETQRGDVKDIRERLGVESKRASRMRRSRLGGRM
jgi:hypothetical protein